MSQTRTGNDADAGIGQSTKSEYEWLFSAPRRRMALKALEESTVPLELEELATAVAVAESDGATDETDEAAVALSLHHSHLPKMDRLGVIEYDHDAKRVTSYQ